MDIIIIGAGPAGLTLGPALARRGHRVMAVDRDPGPEPHGAWRRRGVMQFDQAHGFRPQVRDLLLAEWPAAWHAWIGLGAEPVELPTPDGSPAAIGVRSRRITYERALRKAAADVAGLHVVVGNVDELVERGGRVVGAVVDGSIVTADLVIDASGRLTRLAAPPELNGDVGMAYVSRTYRRHAGAPPGPMTGPVAWSAMLDGYDTYVFPHERRHISAVIIRPTADRELGALRHRRAFDAAARHIPGLAEWTDPSVTTPTSDVQIGGGMRNSYRPQATRPGLVAIGDAVATTAPTAGRGVAMASMQIRALLALLDGGADPVTDRRAVRRLVRHLDPPLGRRSPRLRRRGGAPLAGRRPRSHPATHLAGNHRRRPGRTPDRVPSDRLPHDDRAAGVTDARRATRPRRLPDRLAATQRPTDLHVTTSSPSPEQRLPARPSRPPHPSQTRPTRTASSNVPCREPLMPPHGESDARIVIAGHRARSAMWRGIMSSARWRLGGLAWWPGGSGRGRRVSVGSSRAGWPCPGRRGRPSAR